MMRRAFVIGWPVAHSLSPAIHNAAFGACGIEARYEAAAVAPGELDAWIRRARTPQTLGFNVTVPHKEAVVAHLDRIEGDARLAGAVNTVAVLAGEISSGRQGLVLVGNNSDTLGFRRSLEEEGGVGLHGERVLLLGAGGGARAVALAALQDGADRLWVANRHRERADDLLKMLAPVRDRTQTKALALADSGLPQLLAEATLIVNATSVGLQSNELPVDPTPLRSGQLVVDLVYTPRETVFLQAARRRGARVLGGLGMLVYQAAAAFETWTGVSAPVSIMRDAAEQALA